MKKILNSRRRESEQRFSRRIPARAAKLAYDALESRQLLAVDFSFSAGVLSIHAADNGAAASSQFFMAESDLHYTFTLTGNSKFNGTEMADMMFLANDSQSLFISKDSVEQGVFQQFDIDLIDSQIRHVVFEGDYDLSPLANGINLLTQGDLSQTGSLQISNLRVAAANVNLADGANQIKVFGVASQTNLPFPADIVINAGDTLDAGMLRATQRISLTAGTLNLPYTVYGPVVEIEASNSASSVGRGSIRADHLFVSGMGNFEFANTLNLIGKLSGSVGGNLSLSGIGETRIERSVDSTPGTPGLTVGGNFSLNTEKRFWNLFQSNDSPLVVGGTTTLDVGEGVVDWVFADMNTDGMNDNNLNSLSVISAKSVEFADKNNLIVNSATVDRNLFIATGGLELGRLTLAGNIRASGQILLHANSGIQQTGGIIETPELILGTSLSRTFGDISLDNLNAVFGLSAWMTDGTLDFRSFVDTTIQPASYVSIGGSVLADHQGLDTNSSANLSASRLLDSDNAVIRIAGNFSVQSTLDTILSDGQQNVLTVEGSTHFNSLGSVDVGRASMADLRLINLKVNESVFVRQSSDLYLLGDSFAGQLELVTSGTIASVVDSSLIVSGTSTFRADNQIILGNTPTQNLQLQDAHFWGNLGVLIGGHSNVTIARTHFVSAGSVSISQVGFLNLFDDSLAQTLYLESNITIRDGVTATLAVTGDAAFRAQVGISLGDQATNSYHICGTADFDAEQFILLHPDGYFAIHQHSVRDGVFASLSIDSTEC